MVYPATATRYGHMRTNAGVAVMGADQLLKGVAAAVEAAGRLQSRQLQALGEVFQRGLQNGSRTRAMFEDIGLAAQRSVVQSYGQLVSARETTSYYRISPRFPRNKRYAGGALRRAIQSSSFFEATPGGIRFVNTSLLDREAKHWHRLNFGAAPRGEGSRGQFAVEWGGLVIASLGYDQDASPGFLLPRGFWVEGGERVSRGIVSGGAEFYPVGELPAGTKVRGRPNAAQRTLGIEARNFLDAGLRRIAQMLPESLQDFYTEIYEQAKRGEGPLTTVANAPRPAPQSTGVLSTFLHD
jgi:hypothetical protein